MSTDETSRLLCTDKCDGLTYATDSSGNKVCVDGCESAYSESYYPFVDVQKDGMYKCTTACPSNA